MEADWRDIHTYRQTDRHTQKHTTLPSTGLLSQVPSATASGPARSPEVRMGLRH